MWKISLIFCNKKHNFNTSTKTLVYQPNESASSSFNSYNTYQFPMTKAFTKNQKNHTLFLCKIMKDHTGSYKMIPDLVRSHNII